MTLSQHPDEERAIELLRQAAEARENGVAMFRSDAITRLAKADADLLRALADELPALRQQLTEARDSAFRYRDSTTWEQIEDAIERFAQARHDATRIDGEVWPTDRKASLELIASNNTLRDLIVRLFDGYRAISQLYIDAAKSGSGHARIAELEVRLRDRSAQLTEAQADRDNALEQAACIADEHWSESGHVPKPGAVSCAMSISIMIRRLKSPAAARLASSSEKPCESGCRYAADVGMPEHHCADQCRYLHHPDNVPRASSSESGPVTETPR